MFLVGEMRLFCEEFQYRVSNALLHASGKLFLGRDPAVALTLTDDDDRRVAVFIIEYFMTITSILE